MPVLCVPAPLRDQLGEEAAAALGELLVTEREEWSDRVLTMAIDRFECRLVTEVGALRREMYDALSGLRHEVATSRVELLKWSFVFWIGQVAAVAALLGLLLPGRWGH